MSDDGLLIAGRWRGAQASFERFNPFGGVKASGTGGREQGESAREFFTELKTVYIEDI